MFKKCSMEFGKKEKVLNYACQTYQLSRPGKVGAVMALIRECQPKTLEEWEKWYFENAVTSTKNPALNARISRETIEELGERLYAKIIEVVIPEWQAAFKQLTLKDCIDYIYNLTINRTYDGFIREKSVVNDELAGRFPTILFKESDPMLDHAGDVDYVASVNGYLFGLQIKPITATSNFGGYSLSERMKGSFKAFNESFGGNVFVVLSDDGSIANKDIIDKIEEEIKRLKSLLPKTI